MDTSIGLKAISDLSDPLFDLSNHLPPAEWLSDLVACLLTHLHPPGRASTPSAAQVLCILHRLALHDFGFAVIQRYIIWLVRIPFFAGSVFVYGGQLVVSERKVIITNANAALYEAVSKYYYPVISSMFCPEHRFDFKNSLTPKSIPSYFVVNLVQPPKYIIFGYM